jgi:hypothetical protein
MFCPRMYKHKLVVPKTPFQYVARDYTRERNAKDPPLWMGSSQWNLQHRTLSAFWVRSDILMCFYHIWSTEAESFPYISSLRWKSQRLSSNSPTNSAIAAIPSLRRNYALISRRRLLMSLISDNEAPYTNLYYLWRCRAGAPLPKSGYHSPESSNHISLLST